MNQARCFVAAALALGVAWAHGSETQTYCALGKARAQVQSELLKAPESYGQIGDPSTSARALTLGIRKSLARDVQGRLIDRIAEAQCAAYASQRELAEQIDGVASRAESKAIEAKQALLQRALDAAQENAVQERTLFASQNATIADMRVSYDMRDRLRSDLEVMAGRRSILRDQLPASTEPLHAIVARGMAAQAEVAELQADLASQSGWDLVVAAGARKDLASGAHANFVGVTASRSFGYAASRQAAAEVGRLTTQLLKEERSGAYQQLLRAVSSVTGVHAAQEALRSGLRARRVELDESLQRVAYIETAQAERLRRQLRVELLVIEAEIRGADASLADLEHWISLNKVPLE